MSLKKIIGLVVIILIILIGIFVFVKSSKKPTLQKSPQLETVVKQIVSSYLKSPGSAQFVELIIEKQINPVNEYIVLGDVDSQNGFGALLRTHFFLRIIDKGGDKQSIDNWTTNQLVLDNVGIIFDGKPYDTPLVFDGDLLVAQKQLEDSVKGSK